MVHQTFGSVLPQPKIVLHFLCGFSILFTVSYRHSRAQKAAQRVTDYRARENAKVQVMENLCPLANVAVTYF